MKHTPFHIKEHPYYRKSIKERNILIAKCVLSLLAINSLFGLLIYFLNPIFLPLVFILLWLSLSVLAPFIDTPQLVKSGRIQYLSPMLLMEKEKKNIIQLHGGTLLEYLFFFKKDWNSGQRKHFVLKQFAKGILELMNREELSEKKITGTSYILKKATLQKLGFTVLPPKSTLFIILIFNFFPLTIANSLVYKKLHFPNFSRINTFEIKIADLEKNRQRFNALAQRYG